MLASIISPNCAPVSRSFEGSGLKLGRKTENALAGVTSPGGRLAAPTSEKAGETDFSLVPTNRGEAELLYINGGN